MSNYNYDRGNFWIYGIYNTSHPAIGLCMESASTPDDLTGIGIRSYACWNESDYPCPAEASFDFINNVYDLPAD